MIFYADMGINVDVAKVGDMDARLDQFLEALTALEDADPQVSDIDLTATISTGEVSITMYIDTEEIGEASQKLIATVRAALHKIGESTPGWEIMARAIHEGCVNLRTVDRELSEA